MRAALWWSFCILATARELWWTLYKWHHVNHVTCATLRELCPIFLVESRPATPGSSLQSRQGIVLVAILKGAFMFLSDLCHSAEITWLNLASWSYCKSQLELLVGVFLLFFFCFLPLPSLVFMVAQKNLRNNLLRTKAKVAASGSCRESVWKVRVCDLLCYLTRNHPIKLKWRRCSAWPRQGRNLVRPCLGQFRFFQLKNHQREMRIFVAMKQRWIHDSWW